MQRRPLQRLKLSIHQMLSKYEMLSVGRCVCNNTHFYTLTGYIYVMDQCDESIKLDEACPTVHIYAI